MIFVSLTTKCLNKSIIPVFYVPLITSTTVSPEKKESSS